MPKPSDHFEPMREAVKQDDGTWKITVTPPEFTGFSPSTITLTPDQYLRYQEWSAGYMLVQDAFPDLTASQREILMTGIGSEEFDAVFREDN